MASNHFCKVLGNDEAHKSFLSFQKKTFTDDSNMNRLQIKPAAFSHVCTASWLRSQMGVSYPEI